VPFTTFIAIIYHTYDLVWWMIKDGFMLQSNKAYLYSAIGLPLAVIGVWVGYTVYWDNVGVVLPDWVLANSLN